MTRHDLIVALEVELHSHDNHEDVTWLDGFKDGIERAIQIVAGEPETPCIRPIRELLAELQHHEQQCRERGLDDDSPGLTETLDSACIALETITQHEYDRDYTAALAEASRDLQLKDITTPNRHNLRRRTS
ncbi:hypothetical protein [Arachnia propionica]|uniref:Uncharacterized protein n=1 Tax=Arachnia propionica TaxID=1750 RepID=A0A3P1X1A7_9ACTN|nr:hypothetical protein [Arachnia propionica]RRD50513.1 hypothetical protein EII35_03680 [Arachnia propionica]